MDAASFKPDEGVAGGIAFAAGRSSAWLGVIVLLTLLILGAAFRVDQNLTVTIPAAAGGDRSPSTAPGGTAI